MKGSKSYSRRESVQNVSEYSQTSKITTLLVQQLKNEKRRMCVCKHSGRTGTKGPALRRVRTSENDSMCVCICERVCARTCVFSCVLSLKTKFSFPMLRRLY